MEKIFKNKKGITLVALVVTIIILLILAGISIATLTGSGLFEKARLAEQEYKNAEDYEKTEIAKYSNLVDMFTNSNRNTGTGVKMTSPKLLCSASLPGTSENNRSAGTYKASSDSYNKQNETIFSDYLSFEKDVGWTVKKAGWYYFRGNAQANANSNTVDESIYLYINGNPIDENYIRAHKGYLERIYFDPTIYLEENDIIDFEHKTTMSSNWNNASFKIYTMTQ